MITRQDVINAFSGSNLIHWEFDDSDLCDRLKSPENYHNLSSHEHALLSIKTKTRRSNEIIKKIQSHDARSTKKSSIYATSASYTTHQAYSLDIVDSIMLSRLALPTIDLRLSMTIVPRVFLPNPEMVRTMPFKTWTYSGSSTTGTTAGQVYIDSDGKLRVKW